MAIYGTLLQAIIFYNKLSKHLTDHGLVQNKYDMSTFNKMVNGEQITVQFHVDDLKVSHKDHAVLDDFLDDLRSEFGQEDILTENKGLVLKYLGIELITQLQTKLYSLCSITYKAVIFKAADDL